MLFGRRQSNATAEDAGCVKRTSYVWRYVSRTLLFFASTASLFGCTGDRGPERVVVSGVVTYQGKPVPDGMIRFVPVQTSAVPSAAAVIVDGRYRADGHGGVPVGTHKIQIEGYQTVPSPDRPETLGPLTAAEGGLRQQNLPEKYNASTQLEITIPPGSGGISKDFNLAE